MIVDLDGFTVYSEQDQLTETVKFKLVDLTDWYSSPPVRIDVSDIPNQDGAFNPVRTYRGGKVMSLQGVSYGGTPQEAIRDAWGRIAAIAPDGGQMTLTVTDDAGTLTQRVWLNGTPTVNPFGPNRAKFSIPLIATDPRKYGAAQTLQTAPSGSSGDGLQWPLFASGYLDFGAFSPTGLLSFTNGGTAESWPIFRVRGTIGAAGFQIRSDGDVVEYDAAVPLGTEVVLSPYAGGRASIAGVDVSENLVQSEWPSIKPGETRTYVFTPNGTSDANALLTATFQEASW